MELCGEVDENWSLWSVSKSVSYSWTYVVLVLDRVLLQLAAITGLSLLFRMPEARAHIYDEPKTLSFPQTAFSKQEKS